MEGGAKRMHRRIPRGIRTVALASATPPVWRPALSNDAREMRSFCRPPNAGTWKKGFSPALSPREVAHELQIAFPSPEMH